MTDETTITIRHEDGSYWATVEAFPGVFATGETLDALRESLEEGIALYVAAPGEPARRVILQDLRWDDPPKTEAHAGLVYA